MDRVLALIYGTVMYVLFLGTFLYAIWFVWTMDSLLPVGSGWQTPLLINALLLSAFAIQHSVMARKSFKRVWTKLVPESIERSTYVLATCAVMWLMFLNWRQIPGVAWDVQDPTGRMALTVLSGLGWMIVLAATFMIDHFDLFGLRQVWRHFRGIPAEPHKFASPMLYKMVRHPIYLGFSIAFWSAPTMSYGHLFFAIMTVSYMLVGIQLEERDLVSAYGEDYKRYRRRVSMLIPWPRKQEEA